MVGGQRRGGDNAGVIHDDGVAFAVTGTGGIAVDAADELLPAVVAGHAAAYHIGAAALAVQADLKIGDRLLIAGGHDLLVNGQRGAGCQIAAGLSQRVVYPGDLGGLHFHHGAFLQMDDGGGVHHPLAAARAFAVVLFHIAQAGALPDVKGVNAVVGGFAVSGAVDAAAGNNGHIGVFPDVEIIVDQVLQPGLAYHHRDMHAFVFGARGDDDIDAGFVGLGDNIDVGGGIAPGGSAVGADIVGADRKPVQIGNFLQ